MHTDPLPAIRFVLPLNSETRWSDMLAVLMTTDPEPFCNLIGVEAISSEIVVDREVSLDTENRPDLVLRMSGRPLAVVEVKVLAGLGHNQLRRYREAEPEAIAYILIHPGRLAVDTTDLPGWQRVSWEQVLDAYAVSTNVWAATTAQGWLAHLDRSLPSVTRATVWNDIAPDKDIVIALRARISWTSANIRPPAGIDHDLVGSSAGNSWVVRMFKPAFVPGYSIVVEAEEQLAARFFKPVRGQQASPILIGPSIKVLLVQSDVDTSLGFDWNYLLAMWPLMRAARSDWVRNPAQPKAPHDRLAHQAMVAAGGPNFLGVGFGDRQTALTRVCMFGARIQLDPTTSLEDLAVALNGLGSLIESMAWVNPQL